MIKIETLLPPLSPDDAREFRDLCRAHAAATATIQALGTDARRARKDEIRAALKDPKASPKELRQLSEELSTLSDSYLHAKRGAKQARASLTPRYGALLPRLIDAAMAHADTLIEKAEHAYAEHFAGFDAVPTGASPMVAFLRRYKWELDGKKTGLSVLAKGTLGSLSQSPRSYIEYPSNVGADTEENLL